MDAVYWHGRKPNPELAKLLSGSGITRSAVSDGAVDVIIGPRGACVYPKDYNIQAIVLTREDLETLLREMEM